MMESGLTASDVLALTRNEETDMWNNPFVYLVWIWAFSAFGGGGFGFGRGADAQGALTRSDLFEGFNTQEINGQLRGITNGLCDGFYGLNSSLLSGFNALGAQVAENRFAAQNCCCETNRNIDAVRYENAKNTCDIITAANLNTRDIIEAQNCGFQKIADMMTQDKIDSLRTELQAAQLQLGNFAQTQTLINELRPCAKPAYITCSPYANYFNGNCGCGF